MSIPTSGTITAARAAIARTALESWGGALAGALDQAAPALRGARPLELGEGLARLAPLGDDAIRSTGWEVRHAFAWRNDMKCLQRANLTAMSLAERSAGSLGAAFGRAGADDALQGAIAVTHNPSRFGGARFHAAAVARSADGEPVVIDHLLTRADDGVLPLDDWLRRVGGREDTTRIVPATHMTPLGLTGGPGIPAIAKPIDGTLWRQFASDLAASWDEGARNRMEQMIPMPQAVTP